MSRAELEVGVVCVIPRTQLERRLLEVLPASMPVVHANDFAFSQQDGLHASAFEDSLRPVSRADPLAVFVVCPPGLFDRAQHLTKRMRALAPKAALFLATEGVSPHAVFELLQLDVDDYITSPFRPADVLPRLWRLVAGSTSEQPARAGLQSKAGLDHLVGNSPRFLDVVEKIALIAKCDVSVLIAGETGTGKEVCARAIHYLGARAQGPFIPVNCGAIPLELIENELFGHERAAYTSAVSAHAGLIREAEGGTLFLDEVDCLPPTAQVKLLRFLQEKEYRPLGSCKTRCADVRLIAASNTELEAAVRHGRLRQDFYFRINVLPLTLPPLRERLQDVPVLARHFLRKFAAQLRRPVPTLSAEAEGALLNYAWPGNVRELEHVIERAMVLAENRPVIGPREILLPTDAISEPDSFRRAKIRAVTEFERSYIESLLVTHQGNISHAARAAGKNRRAFWELVRKHKIDAKLFRGGQPEADRRAQRDRRCMEQSDRQK